MCQLLAGQDPARCTPQTRRLRLNGQSTSLRLEAAFWEIIDEMAGEEGLSTPALISKMLDEMLLLGGEAQNFSSLLRCSCLLWLQARHHPAPPAQVVSGYYPRPPAGP